MRSNRRTPAAGGCFGTARYRRQNRRGAPQPVRLGILAHQPPARRPVSHAASESSAAEGAARVAPVLPPRLLRAGAVAAIAPFNQARNFPVLAVSIWVEVEGNDNHRTHRPLRRTSRSFFFAEE